MESPTDQIELLFEKTKHYTQTSVELYKLKVIDKSADIISTLVARIAIGLFLVLFIITINIGIALWIGDALGKTYLGFLIVSGFYGLVSLVLYVMRDKWIKSPLRNSIIIQALN
jgi:hypothetical protein